MTKRRNIILYVILFLVVLAGFYFWFLYPKEVKIGNLEIKSEAKVLAGRVGKHFVVPTDEVPTVATVTDPEKLKGQAFFSKAKKGDKVLIYTNAKEAILYDPNIDKVVAVAPLNIGVPDKTNSEMKNKKDQGLKTNTTKGEF